MKSRYLTFLFLTFSFISQSQNNPVTLESLSKDVKTLKDSVDSFRKKQVEDSATIAVLQEIKQTLSSPLETVKKTGIVALVTLGLLSLFLGALNTFTPNWYVQIIQKLVERYEEVNTLKRNKSILVVSLKNATNKDFIESMMKEFNVSEKLEVDKNTYAAPTKSFDIIFANNETGEIEPQVWEEYLNKFPKAYLFYFGQTFDRLSPNIKRVSFANARAQVYSNLISIMKFHFLTRPKIENS
jgi:hypothetical protein